MVHENNRERESGVGNPEQQTPVRDPHSTGSTVINVGNKRRRQDSPGTIRSRWGKIYIYISISRTFTWRFTSYMVAFLVVHLGQKKKKLLILAETCFPCKNAQQALVRNILFFFPRIIHYSACQAAANGKLHWTMEYFVNLKEGRGLGGVVRTSCKYTVSYKPLALFWH